MYHSDEFCYAGGYNRHVVQMTRRSQSRAGYFSDVPERNGVSSASMKQLLREEDLGDLELFFRYRGIRTLHALRSQTAIQQSVLSLKAKDFLESLDVYVYHSDLQNKLDYLFGRLTSGRSSAVAAAPHPLTHLDSDTKVKKALGAALYNAYEVFSWESYCACTLKLQHGRELIQAACLEVATGLSLLAVDKDRIKSDADQELLKAAKLAMRNVYFWYCAGSEGGLDSRDALERAFKRSLKHTTCDDNTGTDLLNGYNHIMNDLAGNSKQATHKKHGRGSARQDKHAAASGSNDPHAPSSKDPMLVPLPFSCPTGDKVSGHRSLSPLDRAPGRSVVPDSMPLQVAQIHKMLMSLVHDMKDVKGQGRVGQRQG